MNKRILFTTFLALAMLIPSLVAGQSRDRGRDQDKDTGKNGPWIHIEVIENGEDGAKVKINLPLSMARIALEMAPADLFEHGRIEIDDFEIELEDIRKAWSQLRDAGDAEFITVHEKDTTVRVFRKGNRILVHCDGENDELVRIEVPVEVVDALLSGRGDEFDFDAALAALEKMDGEIVRVQDGDDLIRVWIE